MRWRGSFLKRVDGSTACVLGSGGSGLLMVSGVWQVWVASAVECVRVAVRVQQMRGDKYGQ